MRHTIEEFEPNAGDAADAITSAWDQTQRRVSRIQYIVYIMLQ